MQRASGTAARTENRPDSGSHLREKCFRAGAMKLVPTLYEKPWGRTELPSPFDGMARTDDGPIGEIWFESPDRRCLPVLVKYLFTDAKLSVQVHPDDDHATAS